MRLKSLEIKGFKSFADKTVINFDEGITGIIGPNGCGKSNIIDSIRWVIGEHKISNLRSENLESLVFNGSKTRSASGLAEVSLTFENTRNLLPTEFTTVTVTRRFYKNGDSEYRLNDVQCRLKDIHNLFMDTGISNDSYAIIELGMVDDIIKDKENSRRRMLEQAAGITIYKTRKKEAKAKLDATEQDIARIEDLLFEINNQLKALENQAKKAEKYFEIKKEYRQTSIELAKASLQDFNAEYRNLTDEQQAQTDNRVALEAAIATAEAELERSKLGFVEQEKQLHTQQQAFNALVQNLRLKENEKNLAAQQLKFLTEKETELSNFLQTSAGQLQGLVDSTAYTTAQLEDEHIALQQLSEQLNDLKAALDQKRDLYDTQREALDQARAQLQVIQRQQFDAEKQVAVADTSILNYQRSIAQLQDEQAHRQDQLAAEEVVKQQKAEDLQAANQALQTLQHQNKIAKAQILEGQAGLEKLRSALVDQNRIFDQRRNEYDLLKSLIDSMEGYPDSVKFLHKNPNWNHNAPILSDIIYVAEQYRTAVENVLEPYLNYYVVSDLAEGLQAVSLLENHQKGKANFFLLNAINAFVDGENGQHATAHGLFLPGAKPAMEVIEVDARYRNLAKHLLGNVFIAEDESVLSNSGDHIVLEKSGKYVKGKYSLTGGSIGLFEGKKIGRAKNLEKLLTEISGIEAIIDDLKQRISRKQAEVLGYNEQLQEQAIRQTEQSILQLTNASFASQNKLENLQAAQQQAAIKLVGHQDQLAEQQDAIAAVRSKLTGLIASLQQAQQAIAQQEDAYRLTEADYRHAAAAHNEGNLGLAKQQSKIAALQQELRFKEQQLASLQQQIADSTRQLGEASAALATNSFQLQEASTELEALMVTKSLDEKALNEADQAYYNQRNTIVAAETALRTLAKSKEAVEAQLGAAKDQLNNLKLQLAGIKERLLVEFKIELDNIIDEARETDATPEELQAAADKMKKRLENLGEVNPTAIEAFTEMKKRYEFILEQKTDLVNARESLMQTIQEVEATANQQFLTTFNAVRENFQRVFKALFTEEDTADMILEHPDNLADTGIDIVAKPKGKRPSSITQLSGGEKTLTATALLFAIYLIKPAPFCILDEVDAPLDDANVGKFTNMIKQFSENSQFIIVTHNKQTMSAVDVIYGVTMQEAGVSKLVPVDFRSLS
ncbi:MAG: chromosome segregation protein SMC [Bacteroidetes bacterium]|nr:MAG: chromosome segregation protein SMC [Bacteroidota bacterium]